MKGKHYAFLVEPSDKRNSLLLDKLKEKYTAEEFSFEASEKYTGKDTVVVFSPARKLSLAEAAKLPQGATVTGGGQSEEVKAVLNDCGITYINLIENELYAVKNALLTAEGALALIISGTDKSIYGNNVLILGCGRVGKATALLLQRIGVKVSAATFNKAEFDAHAFYAGKAFYGYDFAGFIRDYDVIINTIPKAILDDAVLCKVKPETIIIELASVCCLDKDNAGKYPFKYIMAQGLPAKYSAESAADIMLEAMEYSINKNYGKNNG